MESWAVQLLTLLGVAIGAFASFISTRLLERNRWRREEMLRWDSKRLECYIDFASTIMRYITIGYRITAGLGLTAHVQSLDARAGLPELAKSEAELSEKWEQIMMLGSPRVITACQEWRNEAWHLDRFARGLRKDPLEYEKATQDRRAAQKSFYSAVRADLGIVSGDIPSLDPANTWDSWRRQYEQEQSSDPLATSRSPVTVQASSWTGPLGHFRRRASFVVQRLGSRSPR